MSSINLRPLRADEDAHQYLSQVVLLPTKLQRTQALNSLNSTHVDAALDTVEALLICDNIVQREPALDLSVRVTELQRRDLLKTRLAGLLTNSSFPLKNIIWLICRLQLKIPENTVLRLYTHSDRETVLPYLFYLYAQGKWTHVIENIFIPHPDIHVRLWSQYFSKRSRKSHQNKSDSHELLELHRLHDSRVRDWIQAELGRSSYDEDILTVLLESPDASLFVPLWRAIWKSPKHQKLALGALDALTPFDETATEVLFRRAHAATSHAKRRYFADKLAQRASKVVYHQVRSLCRSLDQDARLLGVEILEGFGSPWHSARPACTQLLLERLNDPALKVRRAAVKALQQAERCRIQRQQLETLSAQDLTQLNRAWEGLAVTPPARRDGKLEDRRLATPQTPKQSANPLTTNTLSGLVPALNQTQHRVLTRGSAVRSLRKPILHQLIQRTPPIALFIGLLMSTLGFSMHTRTTDLPSTSITQLSKPQRLPVPGTTGGTLSLELPHSDILLERSDTWYLYHRYPVATSATYVANGPTPDSTDAPHWKLYSTWLIRILCADVRQGHHRRVAEFLTTLLPLNPTLANLMIPQVFEKLPTAHKDELAVSILRGGRSVPSKDLHPSVMRLKPYSRALLKGALDSGWKTRNEMRLLSLLNALNDRSK